MLLALSFGTALGILPFTIYRFIEKDWYVAILDLLVVIFMVFLGLYIYKTRNLKVAAIILIFIAIGGNIFSFYLKGITQIYWVYPAMLSSYYILKPRLAATVNGFLLLMYLPGFINQINKVGLSTVITTILVTNLIAYVFSVNLDKKQKELEALALKDYLTQIGNRRKLDEDLMVLQENQDTNDSNISFLLLDLDHFKAINDTYGHVLGDRVLFNISQILQNYVSAENIYRYGGEEFLMICHGHSGKDALILAEKMRKEIETSDIISEQKITVSIGVAEITQGGIKSWIHKVDQALYDAKNSGRNRSILA